MSQLRLFNRFVFISLALSVLSVSSVNAALTSIDWLNPGDNLLTVDNSGLQWLDLSQTSARSYNDVSSKLDPGGEFAGFRYATRAEVEGLWTSAGGTAPYDGWSSTNNGVFDILAPLWGDLYCDDSNSCSTGDGYSRAVTAELAYGFGPSVTAHFSALASNYYVFIESTTGDIFDSRSTHRFDTSSSYLVGHALVRASVVPIPATAWLFGTGILGLIGFSKRRKAT